MKNYLYIIDQEKFKFDVLKKRVKVLIIPKRGALSCNT